ncbi:MAG: ferritin-like domain-containing protein [Campylobacterota bacterium]|nr:ferritin-like domain-containing protein [Campylobacterota bacterium]
MNYFEDLHVILTAQTPKDKIEKFRYFYDQYKINSAVFHSDIEAEIFAEPSYRLYCSVVPPQDVPRRKNLQSRVGQIALLHAVAHIEYSAIDLALDAAYRFRDMPKAYYDDWLEVADDEIRHFEMLNALLVELGCHYGDETVHNALFEAQECTAHSLLHRMAVVPRYLEANGLDATPQILEKLKRLPCNEMLEKIMDRLQIIVDEEVSHVQKGDRWFTYACEIKGVSKGIYFEIIERYYPNTFNKPRHINIEGRKASGFTCKELEKISSQNVC